MNNLYQYNCPECGKERFFTDKKNRNKALKNKLHCNNCGHRGKKASEETRRKMSEIHKGNKSMSGMFHSEESKAKISLGGKRHWRHVYSDLDQTEWERRCPKCNKKIIHTSRMRYRNSVKNNRVCYECRARIIALKRYLETGLPFNVDKGATEYFQYQNEGGYNFIENYLLKDIGYIVDGYDTYHHIVCEFDTPYHNNLSQQKKDAVRQNNIINHFQSIGNPLNGFYRVKSTDCNVN